MQEGQFNTIGNRWGRYGMLCIDQVQLRLEAFPDPSVSYSISSDRCSHAGSFGTYRRPTDFFKRPVPEQIDLLETAIAKDLRAFARRCKIDLDAASFIDDRFDQFYVAYGDGWWFDRLDHGFRLTPNVIEENSS